MSTSYSLRIELPAQVSGEAREAFSQIVVRLASPLSFQGVEDWQAEAGERPVLGIEREFHDLTRAGTLNREMRVYFARKADALVFSRALRSVFADLRVGAPRALGSRDWMKAWRKHYRTQTLREGREGLLIVPSWRKAPRASRALVVRISPGQAFGTGTHATTQLCLRLFLREAAALAALPRLRCLDFGAGTGVLAIAAEKWAAREGKTFAALAVESDPVALEQCRKNLRLNRSRRIAGARRPRRRAAYDFVFANVLAPVLLAEKERLAAALAPGGRIVLSGILASEQREFRAAFAATRLEFVCAETQGDWCALLWCKPVRA